MEAKRFSASLEGSICSPVLSVDKLWLDKVWPTRVVSRSFKGLCFLWCFWWVRAFSLVFNQDSCATILHSKSLRGRPQTCRGVRLWLWPKRWRYLTRCVQQDKPVVGRFVDTSVVGRCADLTFSENTRTKKFRRIFRENFRRCRNWFSVRNSETKRSKERYR